jgi:hypothetical protein
MDIKSILEMCCGLPVADTVFTKPQKVPFVVFLDKQTTDGDDFNTRIIAHDLAVEFYAERIDSTNEKKLEKAFAEQGWKYERDREYLSDQKCFETVYSIQTFYEKIGKEE